MFIFTFSIPAFANETNLYVNGKKQNIDIKIKKSKTYAPIRSVAETLGAKVTWNGNVHLGKGLNEEQEHKSKFNNKFKMYEDLRKNILSFSLNKNDVSAFDKLFQDKEAAKLEKVAKECIKLNDTYNHSAKVNKYRKLYRIYLFSPLNSDVLYHYLSNKMNWLLKERVPNHRYPGMLLAWSWADGAQACIYAYEYTGETRFLDLIITGFDIALKYRDSKIGKNDAFRERPMDGWGFSRPPDKRWETEITLPGRILTPVLNFCQLVNKSTDLKKQYGEKVATYEKISLNILEQYIREMKIKENGEGYFINLRLKKHEPINHQAAYARACAVAYNLTKDNRYKQVVEGFKKYLFSNATLEANNAYSWPYKVRPQKPSKEHPSMVWKASVTVATLAEIERQGFEISDENERRIANTLLKNVHRRFSNFHVYISKDKHWPMTGYNIATTDRAGLERLLSWIVLDEFKFKVRDVVLEGVSTRCDLFPMGWFGNNAGACAYAYYLKQSGR